MFVLVSANFGDGPLGNCRTRQSLFFAVMLMGVERKRGRFHIPTNATVAVMLAVVLVACDAIRQLRFAHLRFDGRAYLRPQRLLELGSVATGDEQAAALR